VSTLDLLGPGFTLFTGSAGAPWLSAADAVSESAPIRVHRIGPDTDVRDVEGRWAQLTGLPADGALLLRPDDFVGWRTDALPASPADELRRAICRILARS
jgi:putative polyketide hydroxylase